MNSFKLIVLGIFGAFAVAGIAIFATGGLTGGDAEKMSQVEMWGTIDETMVNEWFEEGAGRDFAEQMTYVRKNSETYDEEVIEALASGNAPDIFLLQHDKIMKFKNKLYPITYENFPMRKFKNEFIREGELYLDEDGAYGLPLFVDPLVMYWNRDIFSAAGVSRPPEFWDELFTLAPKLTVTDENSNILQSAVALGEYSNIKNAKEIISALLFQAGGNVVEETASGFQSVFNQKPTSAKEVPAVSAVRYFTEFSNPAKEIYSWNVSLNNAYEEFVSGNLGIYFGFASEVYSIRKRNPNLDFDVAILPKRDRVSRETFGNMTAIAITKGTDNYAGAVIALKTLSGSDSVYSISEELKLPPARRDLLSADPGESYLEVFYDSAINARGWFDPNPERTEVIFKEMVGSITSGKLNISNAVGRVNKKINNLLH